MKIEPAFIPVSGHRADANARLRHPAERGAWIWHPGCKAHETAILRFTLRFHLDAPACPLVHVTGDQRFQLRCDGQDIAFGPDRCDVEHWTVRSFHLHLPAGQHHLDALVWWLAEPGNVALRADPEAGGAGAAANPPMAQMSWRGGFLVFAEDLDAAVLNTGSAPWQVADLTPAVRLLRPQIPGYHDVGPAFDFDLEKWNAVSSRPAAEISPPLQPNIHGVRRPGWCLHPATIPEQLRQRWIGGRIRSVRDGWDGEPFLETQNAAWQGLLEGRPLTIPPNSKLTVLWDFETYLCGYPLPATQGGRRTLFEWEWAESLFDEKSRDAVTSHSAKGCRDAVDGRVFLGFGDCWLLAGDAAPPSLWWRSGRFARIRIATGAEPLTLQGLAILTSHYPLGDGAAWKSSDAGWDRVMPVFETTFRAAAHETWTDSPYYEQMCYMGDTRLHCLANYAWFTDDRLSRRAIEMFEWSRPASGLVAERYPSAWRQESVTYSMLWPLMLRDFAMWREDPDFVRGLLPGLRSLLAAVEGIGRRNGLLAEAPGWPFVDWVPGWDAGCGPGVREGDSSILNLHWVLCLQAAAEIEQAHGDRTLARRCRRMAGQCFQAVLARFWDARRGLLSDTVLSDAASEHAQFFALLTGLLDKDKSASCLAALRNPDGLAPASIYGSFYLLEALRMYGEEGEFHRRLEHWRGLPDLGFRTTPEAPEPSRSDSHAWGAHPAWHSLASIAGIRPAAPGFRRVRVAPCPGAFESVACSVVHPRGKIEVDLHFAEGAAQGWIVLPARTRGEWVWRGSTIPLKPGENRI